VLLLLYFRVVVGLITQYVQNKKKIKRYDVTWGETVKRS